jgi:hypothetical protein
MAEPLQIGKGDGCQFNLAYPAKVVLCSKVVDAGQKFCPFHLLLIQANKEAAAKKEKDKQQRHRELRRSRR